VRTRYETAHHEVELLQEDLESYPINYNHYYVDNITKTKIRRYKTSLCTSIDRATLYKPVPGCNSQSHTSTSIDITAIINKLFRSTDPNLDKHGCEDPLDCLFSIYKVCPQNTPSVFVKANSSASGCAEDFRGQHHDSSDRRHIIKGIGGSFRQLWSMVLLTPRLRLSRCVSLQPSIREIGQLDVYSVKCDGLYNSNDQFNVL
jgi:hypothetical protein